MDGHILYLNEADIREIDLSPSAIRSAIKNAFKGYGSSPLRVPPKQTLAVSADHYFQSMAAVAVEPSFAAVKWVGLNGGNSDKGFPNVNGIVILSDFETGRPLAIMDGNRLTVLRTAAMSALAAEYLAQPEARSLGFIGCGAQAFGHFEALHAALPGINQVVCFDRRIESAKRLADYATQAGIPGHATDSPTQVLASDVVVSTIPSTKGMEPFLDARELKPGALVISIDMGRSWLPSTFSSFDRFGTDDRAQAEDPGTRSKLAFSGPFDTDLSDLVTNTANGRSNPEERILFLFPGFALADLAVAAELYRGAIQNSIGTVLRG